VIFAFRGIRAFQLLFAVVTLGAGVGAVLLVRTASDGTTLALVPAVVLGLLFLFAFSVALRAPTAFLAVSDERTRLRFPPFVDTVFANSDIAGVRLVRRGVASGLGVRANFRGDVALATAWGTAAEISLRRPIRIWLLPKLIPLRATRLQLSLKNPHKLADRFPAPARPAGASSPASAARKMKNRGPRTR